MPEKNVRLFVAASIPDRVRDAVQRVADELRARWPEARWVPAANQHLTLKFLGWTPPDRIGAVSEVTERVARSHSPAELSLTGLGAFPSAKRVRVLWIGIDDPAELLTHLATEYGKSFEPLGYEVEERPFHSHLTLARFKMPARVPEGLPEIDLSSVEPFTVDAVDLFRSHLQRSGARYELLESFPLTGGR
ncbi:MAG: RNA 2',3'-cyclic phosphodiesterase [Actinomycetota bacterium]|nr:RNA 2',3'-cyclic phosphodiesterase [Actinomycetota bacterium]